MTAKGVDHIDQGDPGCLKPVVHIPARRDAHYETMVCPKLLLLLSSTHFEERHHTQE